MTLQTDLQSAVARVVADSQKLHDIVNGDMTTSVVTDNGLVKSVAKAIHDIESSLIASMAVLTQAVADSIGAKDSAELAALMAEEARDQAIALVGAVKVTPTDTTASQLNDKITTGNGIVKTVTDAAGDEHLHLHMDDSITASTHLMLTSTYL